MARYRVGRKLATTIYRDEEPQPVAWVPNDPALAAHIVALLNMAAEAAESEVR